MKVGKNFRKGDNNVFIHGDVTIGDNCLVGSNTEIGGPVTIGDNVSIQSGVYIPPYTWIGNDVFIGPGTVFTNHKHHGKPNEELEGAIVKSRVKIGANCTILPVLLNEGCIVGAGSVVTRDVPAKRVVMGNPAR